MCPQIKAAFSTIFCSMAKTRIMLRAQHADKMQTFLNDIAKAIEVFEDEIRSMSSAIKQKAYKNFLLSYREVLTPIWNLVRFAAVDTILDTIADKEFKELAVMANKLQPKEQQLRFLKEATDVADLEAITEALKSKFPQQSLPSKEICAQIGEVFVHLHNAHKEYAAATEGLAQLATSVSPDQYTMILNPAALPQIQLVVPGMTLSPMTAPPPPEQLRVLKEATDVADLVAITEALKSKFPQQSLPSKEICAQIGEVFVHLHNAHKEYAAAAEGLAQLATSVSPDQYTMILNPAALPQIQLVVPGMTLSPMTAPPPPEPQPSTAQGSESIISYTKSQVLPNPHSTALAHIDKNSATRVLAAATYTKLEHKYFDTTLSRADTATAFGCNISQLTKAVTGILYKSGPHHYVSKSKATKKRPCDTTDLTHPKLVSKRRKPRNTHPVLNRQPLQSLHPALNHQHQSRFQRPHRKKKTRFHLQVLRIFCQHFKSF